jgi:hypothetical protein
MTSYSNPSHPEHKPWLAARRRRMIWILREGKRTCKLLPEERQKVIELCDLMEKNTKELE